MARQEIVALQTLLVSIAVVLCSQGDEQTCHQHINLIENFSIDKVAGIWYPFLIGNKEEHDKSCAVYNLMPEKTANGTKMIAMQMWRTGKNLEIPKMLAVETTQIKNTSEFRTKWGKDVAKTWCLATDYTTYSVWHVCVPSAADGGVIYVSARTKNPTEEVMEKAKNALYKIGLKIPPQYLQKVERHLCDL